MLLSKHCKKHKNLSNSLIILLDSGKIKHRFRWGGVVHLEMDKDAVAVFKYQLEFKLAQAQDQYNDAKAALDAI